MKMGGGVEMVTPDMTVGPAWLDDVISARIPVLVFRGFTSPDKARVELFECHVNDARALFGKVCFVA